VLGGRGAVAYPTTGEQNPATNTLVNRLRSDVLPSATAGTGIRAYLTGSNAGGVAFANLVGQRLPWLIAVVVLVSMLLLTVMFRSVTIAVKAAVMNLLSISAAYGVLVLISQDGWLHQAFGFPEAAPCPHRVRVPIRRQRSRGDGGAEPSLFHRHRGRSRRRHRDGSGDRTCS
jgi:uncharacterized membrane protein YdfJ with MMPL/SSD domain